jgi:hypothetical protein
MKMVVKTTFEIQKEIVQSKEFEKIVKDTAEKLFQLIPKEDLDGHKIKLLSSLVGDAFATSFDLEFTNLYTNKADELIYGKDIDERTNHANIKTTLEYYERKY